MSEIDYNKEHEDLQEEFIFNNLHLSHLPSDISAFTNNAVEEFTFMRSKAVFSLRSKYANGKIFLTFPVNINPFNKDPLAISSRDQGFRMLSQVCNYPFAFINSKRIYSYISDKAAKSSTGYMMFAIDEVKVSQHLDVQDVLFLEIALIYCDHTSQTADFRFINDPALNGSVDHLSASAIYNGFTSKLYDKKNNIFNTFKTLEGYMQNFNKLSESDVPLSKAIIYSPQVIGSSDPEAAAIRAVAETGTEESDIFKEVKITSQVGDTALTAALTQQANGDIDPEDTTVSGQFSLDYLYVVHRAFHDIELGGDASVQRIVCSRKNKLALHYIGSHQNPFIQYMGKYPGRVNIDLIFNNKDIYRVNSESTIAAINSMSSVLSYNNSQFPEVAAYNTLKIKSLATAALEIVNIVPNQSSIQATSNQRGVESITLAFVESDMEEFMKVGNVIDGRNISIVDNKIISSLISYLASFQSNPSASQQPDTQSLNKIENPELHKVVLTSLYTAYQPLRSEQLAGGEVEEKILTDQGLGLKSLDNFPNTINSQFIQKLQMLLGTRASLITMKDKKEDLKFNGTPMGNYTTSEKGKVDLRDTFSRSGMVDNILQGAFYQLSNLNGKGDSRAKMVLSHFSLNDISTTINNQLLNYTGTNINDINLDLVGNQSEAYQRVMQPFFFIVNKPYFDSDDIKEAFNLGDQNLEKLINTVVTKGVNTSTDTATDSQNTGLRYIRDERVMKEDGHQSTITGASFDLQVGAPQDGVAGVYSSSGIRDWVRSGVNTSQEAIRETIRRYAAEYGKGANNIQTFTNTMIQIAGIESGLKTGLKSRSGLHNGVFQMSRDYIATVLGISTSAATPIWHRVLNDYDLNIKIAMQGMAYYMPMMKADGNWNYPAFYVYHQQGRGGARTIYTAYKSGQGAPKFGNAMKSNSFVKYGYPQSGAGNAKDVKNLIDGINAYMQVGMYGSNGSASAPQAAPKPTGSALIKNGEIVYPSEQLKKNTIPVTVLRVLDGDTIEVDVGKGVKKEIRFAGVDAPETAKNYPEFKKTIIVDGKSEYFEKLTVKASGQYGGDEATAYLISLGVKPGVVILMDKATLLDAYKRDVSNLYKTDGTFINREMITGGWAYSTNTRTDFAPLEAQAKKDKKGMWGKYAGQLTDPANFRKLVQEPEKNQSRLEDARRQLRERDGNKKPTETSKPKVPTNPAIATTAKTNTFRPFDGHGTISSGFGRRTTSKATSGSNDHKGLDFPLPNGTPIRAAASGTVVQVRFQRPGKSAAFGMYVRINHHNGFISTYADLSAFKVKVGDQVSYRQIIGLSGNSGSRTGGNFHLHYEVRYGNNNPVHPFYTTPLNEIPRGSRPTDYIDPEFLKGRYSKKYPGGKDTEYNPSIATTDHNAVPDGRNTQNSGAFYSEEQFESESKEDVTVSRNIPEASSVFSEKNQLELQSQIMSYSQKYGVNTAYPVIKAYITVGNENEDIVIGSFVKLNQFFEITGLEDMKLACNHDKNPVDVLTLTIANPSFIRLDNYAIMGHFLTTDYTKVGTTLESQFIGERLTVRPGMKLHIRAGYGNSPNNLKTIFNGAISELSDDNQYALTMVAEGFGKELISYYHSPMKPKKAGGTVTNSSTAMVIGTALQAKSIAHFGWRASFWQAGLGIASELISVAPTSVLLANLVNIRNGLADLIAGTTDEEKAARAEASGIEKALTSSGVNGDYMPDPESKRLTQSFGMDSLLFYSPSYANFRQRLYTNIYAAEISHVHAEYNSNFWTYIKNMIPFNGHQAGYHYLYYNTTPWQAVKEMEYRNPGTLAKPLMYDDRMTMFYGIKEQLYIARDLDPVYMAMSGATDSVTVNESYFEQRPKRFDVVSGFHILSTNTNIITNTMGLNGKYATSVNVLYFDDAGDVADNDLSDFTIEVDDDIASWEIRQKTINFNGTHGRYSAWMYGIQELKNETETMYGGKITVVGNPNLKSGDYCYLQDDLRKLSGIIKVRECYHYMNSRDGYTTVIIPGQYVEAKNFIYSMLFMKLGFAAKMTLAKTELSMKYAENGDTIFQDYLEALKVISTWTEDKGLFESMVDNGSVRHVGFGAFTGLLLLGTKFYANKTGLNLSVSAALNTAASAVKSTGTIGYNTAKFITSVKYGSAWTKIKTDAITKLKDLKGAQVAKATSKKSIIMRMALWTVKLPITITTAPLKFASGVALVSAFKAARALSTVASFASAALMTNPIGWLLNIAGFVLLGYVSMKLEESEVTREPLLFFPVNLVGRPYVAGMRGYQRNSWLEAKKNSWDKNMKEVAKAANFIEATSSSEMQKYVASYFTKNTNSIKVLEQSANDVRDTESQLAREENEKKKLEIKENK